MDPPDGRHRGSPHPQYGPGVPFYRRPRLPLSTISANLWIVIFVFPPAATVGGVIAMVHEDWVGIPVFLGGLAVCAYLLRYVRKPVDPEP